MTRLNSCRRPKNGPARTLNYGRALRRLAANDLRSSSAIRASKRMALRSGADTHPKT
eukprot:CAMPEP_0204235728 /NCGR_PEP_ID=MMETSP0361-20130328/91918_1 /ASSEMBLY_ACC=CAM_ASM_000343 /TAXON_ID=268821 /ORGANISM="Scrippsiella Hangoei, Strain SHTV-5" /LENGTH=56 /DNA_ID=CAMNT_0051207313 /DNA_START=33 /DNA_END=199 /DNA_ORIENTATION=-